MIFRKTVTLLVILLLINVLNIASAQDYGYKKSLSALKKELASYKSARSYIESVLSKKDVYLVKPDIHFDPEMRKYRSEISIQLFKKDAERYIGHMVLEYCLENGVSPNSKQALKYGAAILADIKKSDRHNRSYYHKFLREIEMLEVPLRERIESRSQEIEERNNKKLYSSNSHFSCKDKQNEEGGCCCFRGSHTYRFPKKKVSTITALFDTGKKLNCRSRVVFEIHMNGKWIKVGSTQAVSSRGNSTYAPHKVSIPVKRVIDGFRLGDGCRCCMDNSEIWLH